MIHSAVVTSSDLIELCGYESGEKSKTKRLIKTTQNNSDIITCAGRETGENSSTLK